MKKLYFLLIAFGTIGGILFPEPKWIQKPANDPKNKCSIYSIPSFAPKQLKVAIARAGAESTERKSMRR